MPHNETSDALANLLVKIAQLAVALIGLAILIRRKQAQPPRNRPSP